MKFEIRKAQKGRAKLRMAFVGPAGSGKTMSALKVGQHLGDRIGVIDTEHGSSEKYADRFEFDVLTLDTYSPVTYVQAIHALEEHGCDVIIIDSLSHAWMGKDGALEQVDRKAKKYGGNKFGAWGDVTPMHQDLIESMLGCKAHLIVTMRSKTEYVLDEKNRPQRVGMAPVQRDGVEYEFDVVGDLDQDNAYTISKSRCSEVAGKVFRQPGQALADQLKAWLTDGADFEGQLAGYIAEMKSADEVKPWLQANKEKLTALPRAYRERMRDAARAELEARGEASKPGQSQPPQSGTEAAQ